MLLTVKNIAKIKDAQIALKGITVIAGENNTGKSTVGKALYCLVSSFFNVENKLADTRIERITNSVQRFYSRRRMVMARKDGTTGINSRRIARDVYEKWQALPKDEISGPEALRKLLSPDLMCIFKLEEGDENEQFVQMLDMVVETLLFDEIETLKLIVDNYFSAEFEGEINHVNRLTQIAEVSLALNQQVLSVRFKANKCTNIATDYEMLSKATYVDSPFILDDLDGFYFSPYKHRYDLIHKLRGRGLESNLIDEAISRKKLGDVLSIVNDVADGDFIDNDMNETVFKEKELKAPLHLSNLSTGMKTFVILKRLIEYGALAEQDLLILDEPEVHLHPAWQLKFAEILVLLQKQFDITILLNTHSPYFLNAVEVFSQKYGIADKCAYYLSELQGASAVIEDVGGNTERIYKKLADPFQTLENQCRQFSRKQ